MEKEATCYICTRDIFDNENYYVRYDGEFSAGASCICMDCINRLMEL